jgi:uncharacterized Ntn-hydrolase superfamily protein
MARSVKQNFLGGNRFWPQLRLHVEEAYMTFAVSARCPETGKFGVAISTRPMAVGARCPFIVPGVGVVVSMAYTDPRLGLLGTKLLKLGYSAKKVLEELASSDPNIEYRQISVIDRDGNAVARTGARNRDWSGALTEPNLVAKGNALTSERTATAMFDTYRAAKGVPIEERLMRALEAGRDAGGQHGGQHSANLIIYSKQDYPLVDLRVDEHEEPIGELRRLHDLYAPQAEYYELRPWQPDVFGSEDEWSKRQQAK